MGFRGQHELEARQRNIEVDKSRRMSGPTKKQRLDEKGDQRSHLSLCKKPALPLSLYVQWLVPVLRCATRPTRLCCSAAILSSGTKSGNSNWSSVQASVDPRRRRQFSYSVAAVCCIVEPYAPFHISCGRTTNMLMRFERRSPNPLPRLRFA